MSAVMISLVLREPQYSNRNARRFAWLLWQTLKFGKGSHSTLLEIPLSQIFQMLDAMRHNAFAGSGKAWDDIAPALKVAFVTTYGPAADRNKDAVDNAQHDLRLLHQNQQLPPERQRLLRLFLVRLRRRIPRA